MTFLSILKNDETRKRSKRVYVMGKLEITQPDSFTVVFVQDVIALQLNTLPSSLPTFCKIALVTLDRLKTLHCPGVSLVSREFS